MKDFKPFRPKQGKHITIEKATRTTDSAGGRSTTWATYKTVWAEFMGLGSDEIFQNNQEQNRVTAKCRIRFMSALNATGYRVSFKNRTFNIDSIYDPDETRHYLYLRLVEVKS